MKQAANEWSSVKDIESSATYQALMVAALGKRERRMGDAVIPAELPKWADVRKYARELMTKRPPHVAVLVNAVKAEANLDGFRGLLTTLEQARDALANQWDELLPPADADDPEDPYYSRANLLRELSDEPQFINNLYRIPLIHVREIGAYSTRDIDIAAGVVNADESELARCQDGLIRGAFEKTDVADLQSMADVLQQCGAACVSIETLFNDKAGADNGLSLSTLGNCLTDCHAKFLHYAGKHLAQDSGDSGTDETASADSMLSSINSATDKVAEPEPSAHSKLANHDAVRQVLEQIVQYYQKNEPSSPVVELAYLAHDLLAKPFFAVLQALSPTEKDDFSKVLDSLSSNPLAFLIDDCYQRFIAGNNHPQIEDTSAPIAASQSTETASIPTGVKSVPITTADSGSELATPTPQRIDSTHEPGTIGSRSDVIAAIRELELFFPRNEPASVVPLILAEMRKLVPKSFTELLAEFSRSKSVAGGGATGSGDD